MFTHLKTYRKAYTAALLVIIGFSLGLWLRPRLATLYTNTMGYFAPQVVYKASPDTVVAIMPEDEKNIRAIMATDELQAVLRNIAETKYYKTKAAEALKQEISLTAKADISADRAKYKLQDAITIDVDAIIGTTTTPTDKALIKK